MRPQPAQERLARRCRPLLAADSHRECNGTPWAMGLGAGLFFLAGTLMCRGSQQHQGPSYVVMKEELTATPVSGYSNAYDVRLAQFTTFSVKNAGTAAIYATTEGSPNLADWIVDTEDMEIRPSASAHMAPLMFHHYARLRFRTQSGASSFTMWVELREA